MTVILRRENLIAYAVYERKNLKLTTGIIIIKKNTPNNRKFVAFPTRRSATSSILLFPNWYSPQFLTHVFWRKKNNNISDVTFFFSGSGEDIYLQWLSKPGSYQKGGNCFDFALILKTNTPWGVKLDFLPQWVQWNSFPEYQTKRSRKVIIICRIWTFSWYEHQIMKKLHTKNLAAIKKGYKNCWAITYIISHLGQKFFP